MKERPILFSAPMVRAIIEGKKTQTRRVIKPQPSIDAQGNFCWDGWNFGQDFNGPRVQAIASPIQSSKTKRVHCPLGKPGDQLWVQENFSGPFDMNELPPREWPEFCAAPASELWFWADGNPPSGDWTKPKPSIHMPRWASRISLEITGVRVERLSDINESDARAEGITDGGCTNCGNPEPCGCASPSPDARDSFINLWEQINGPCSWIENMWVWVVEFRRVTA